MAESQEMEHVPETFINYTILGFGDSGLRLLLFYAWELLRFNCSHLELLLRVVQCVNRRIRDGSAPALCDG
jgi:hypothetical protein